MTPWSAITIPIAISGIVLPIRWPKPTCRNGAVTTSGRLSGSRGSMPYRSSGVPGAMASAASSAHITTTIASSTTTPSKRRSRGAEAGSLTPRTVSFASMATTPEHQPSIAPIVGPDDPRRFTDSGIEVQHEYGPDDVGPELDERLGHAGEYPFTRGIHPGHVPRAQVDDAPVRRLRDRRRRPTSASGT